MAMQVNSLPSLNSSRGTSGNAETRLSLLSQDLEEIGTKKGKKKSKKKTTKSAGKKRTEKEQTNKEEGDTDTLLSGWQT